MSYRGLKNSEFTSKVNRNELESIFCQKFNITNVQSTKIFENRFKKILSEFSKKENKEKFVVLCELSYKEYIQNKNDTKKRKTKKEIKESKKEIKESKFDYNEDFINSFNSFKRYKPTFQTFFNELTTKEKKTYMLNFQNKDFYISNLVYIPIDEFNNEDKDESDEQIHKTIKQLKLKDDSLTQERIKKVNDMKEVAKIAKNQSKKIKQQTKKKRKKIHKLETINIIGIDNLLD